MSDLTILCVTRNEHYAQPFLNQMRHDAADIGARLMLCYDIPPSEPMPPAPGGIGRARVRSDGYIESVLDEAIAACPDGYVLRLDDDEKISAQMLAWLKAGEYRTADHWAFPRANLWRDSQHMILNPPLYPDLQTRLSVKAKSGDRREVHVGSPYGTGTVAPCVIEHHKFLVRSREEREELVRRYESISAGAGSEYLMFSLPEEYEDDLVVGWSVP